MLDQIARACRAAEMNRWKVSPFLHVCALMFVCVRNIWGRGTEPAWLMAEKNYPLREPGSLRFGAQIGKATVQRKMFHKMLILRAVSFNFHLSEAVAAASLCLEKKGGGGGCQTKRVGPWFSYLSCTFSPHTLDRFPPSPYCRTTRRQMVSFKHNEHWGDANPLQTLQLVSGAGLICTW